MNGCSGCEIALLDMGEKFLDLLKMIEIVHLPLFMDSKHGRPSAEASGIKLPTADIGLLSGSIKTSDHQQVADAVRHACEIVVAFGTCAAYGGIPALANSYWNKDLMETCFQRGTGKTEEYPSDLVPELTRSCMAIDQQIHVDLYLPGCPPHPDHIFRTLEGIVKKQPFVLPEKSVCDKCPAIREGKGRIKRLKRPLELPDWKVFQNPGESVHCFLEQGFLCMGPVTRSGCGGDKDPVRCISAQVPCRGCYGPVQPKGNPRLAMLNALVSNGIDIGSIPETVSLQRFSGGHGRLHPEFSEKEL